MTRIIAVAMLASLLAWVVVAEAIRALHAPFRGFAGYPAPELIRYLFLALALGALVMSRRVRAWMLPAPAAADPRDSRIAVAQRLQAATLASLGSSEAIAIWGLILFLMWGLLREFYVFLALSLIAFAVNFPRWQQWEQATQVTPQGT